MLDIHVGLGKMSEIVKYLYKNNQSSSHFISTIQKLIFYHTEWISINQSINQSMWICIAPPTNSGWTRLTIWLWKKRYRDYKPIRHKYSCIRLTRPTLWPSHASRQTMSIRFEPKLFIVARLSRVRRSNSLPSCRILGSATTHKYTSACNVSNIKTNYTHIAYRSWKSVKEPIILVGTKLTLILLVQKHLMKMADNREAEKR